MCHGHWIDDRIRAVDPLEGRVREDEPDVEDSDVEEPEPLAQVADD